MMICPLTNSFLLEYHAKCKSGETLIGRELMTELDTLVREMEETEQYRFEPADAHKRILFIENECKHSKSPFAGKPFILELWEKAFIEAIYGFKMLVEGKWARRFTESTLLIGRKNGKSTLCSALALSEFVCGNVGTNILLASNTYDQAAILYDECMAMREQSPRIARISRSNIRGIFMGSFRSKKHTGKFSSANKANIKKISAKAGGSRSAGSKEGLNLDMCVIDETHEMPDETLFMPLRQSMAVKDEPLLFEITTEGFVQDGHLDNRLRDARQVLRGEMKRPRWLIWLYTQDSEWEIWQDERTWTKSNPNLGVTKKWNFLRDLVEEAKTNTATRAFVLAKDFNFPQNTADVWLSPAVIINERTFDIEQFRGRYYISGADFAETTDLCALAMLFIGEDGKKYILPHFWIPAAKADAHLTGAGTNPEKKDYREWARQGFVTIVEDSEVDSATVADYQWKMYEEYGVIPYKAMYDNRFAKEYKCRMGEYFGSSTVENLPQDYKTLSNPMRTLEQDLRVKRVIYNNNPVLYWNFCNTAYKVNDFGQIMPRKSSALSSNRIDGTAACIDAYAGYSFYKSDFMSLQ